ncbi:MAG: SpoIIE family protein phosphatase [Terriglobales bacterium]
MPFDLQVPLEIREESHVGQVRRRAQQMAVNAGLSENQASNTAIIASEAATNIAKHGSGGEVLLRELTAGVEVVAVDKGHGMTDVTRCLSDGYSTSGTPGTGLGAIRRLASEFDIYSRPNAGTAMVARVCRHEPETNSPMKLGVVCRPKAGESYCGDAWAIKQTDGEFWVVVADGLGHGPDAQAAAMEAVRIFRDTSGHRSTVDMMEAMHGALRKTRGAAVAVARIKGQERLLRFAGVGNISCTVLDKTTWKNLMSHNGILGHEVRRIQEFTQPWTPESRLVLNSDGLSSWSLDKYSGLLSRHPSLVAGVLYRDFWRHRDDVTVLVAKEKPSA